MGVILVYSVLCEVGIERQETYPSKMVSELETINFSDRIEEDKKIVNI